MFLSITNIVTENTDLCNKVTTDKDPIKCNSKNDAQFIVPHNSISDCNL